MIIKLLNKWVFSEQERNLIIIKRTLLKPPSASTHREIDYYYVLISIVALTIVSVNIFVF